MSPLMSMLIVSCAATSVLAQTPASPQADATESGVAQRVTGCVSRDEGGDHFTLADVKTGAFELTGIGTKYVGKRVEAKSTADHLRIVGGLWPTPNIAAQAGAIDPLQTTIAAMRGSGSRGTELSAPVLEFRVGRTVKGRCP